MSDWRDMILRQLPPEMAQLTIVYDPDLLLTDARVTNELEARHYHLIPYEDEPSFRFRYETEFYTAWSKGERIDEMVILWTTRLKSSELPSDLTKGERQLRFALTDILPNLSYPVVISLDRSYLDSLYEIYLSQNPVPLGENGTKDFVLRHLFSIAPELMRSPADLLLTIFRLHLNSITLPPSLRTRLITLIREDVRFLDWSLEEMLSDKHTFLEFLQERWVYYLCKLSQDGSLVNTLPPMKYSGPKDLPFEHPDIQAYMISLFQLIQLKPVKLPSHLIPADCWMQIGIEKEDPELERSQRLTELFNSLGSQIPCENASPKAWFDFANIWAELLILHYQSNAANGDENNVEFNRLCSILDDSFTKWVFACYPSLYYRTSTEPLMLHHVPKYLSSVPVAEKQKKIALLILDGLALDQWLLIEEQFKKVSTGLHIQRNLVFAWLPTVTSVSRQALLSGKIPLGFPDSIAGTSKEENLWSSFWLNDGLQKNQIALIKGLGDSWDKRIDECLDNPNLKVLGLIVAKIDRIMHGMELGTAGMHNQVKQWLSQGFMCQLIDKLIAAEFTVFLTSDHGNIEAKGIGRPSEGVLAEQKGERVRIFRYSSLRDRVQQEFPDSIAIPFERFGLPPDFLPLLASGRTAFVEKGRNLVTHGGMALEELIVPFVQITKEV